MTDNHKGNANAYGNIGKLVQIEKVEGDVTIQDTLETKTCCPVCERNDRSQKVSAAHRSLASHEKLHPPVKPQTKAIGIGWYFIPLLTLPGVIAIILVGPISKKNKYAISGLTAATAIGATIREILVPVNLDFFFIPAYVFMILAILIVYYMSLYHEYQRRVAEFHEKTPIWEKAVKKWDILYYCSRDDCVFDPQTNMYVSVNKINELLYDRK